jgi:hypothetical protein
MNILTAEHERQPPSLVVDKTAPLAALIQQESG